MLLVVKENRKKRKALLVRNRNEEVTSKIKPKSVHHAVGQKSRTETEKQETYAPGTYVVYVQVRVFCQHYNPGDGTAQCMQRYDDTDLLPCLT